MKVRESGMPEESVGATFFDPPRVPDQLAFDDPRANVVESGCGYGTFALAAATRTSGTVFAVDIDPAMAGATQHQVRRAGLRNVRVFLRDFEAEGTGLGESSVDYAMLSNIPTPLFFCRLTTTVWSVKKPLTRRHEHRP